MRAQRKMDKVEVKICGITNHEDALTAVRLGASALGFIFARSQREITPEKARDIIAKIPLFVKTIGVFVNERHAKIKQMIRYCGLDLIQLHGDESPEFCYEMMPYTIKAIRIKDESSLKSIGAYYGKVRALLFDTFSRNLAGGTGKTFDWKLAKKIKGKGIPIILSGGLEPSNIDMAIHTVKPYAVDVNSGVEEYPGKKSFVLMRDLMEKVRKVL